MTHEPFTFDIFTWKRSLEHGATCEGCLGVAAGTLFAMNGSLALTFGIFTFTI